MTEKYKYKPKKCVICGKEFIPESGVQKRCKDKHYKPCPICGKPVEMKFIGYARKTCSNECDQKLKQQTNLIKYGVTHPMRNQDVVNKLIQTNVERYGGVGYASEELFEKQKKSLQEHYGVDHPQQSEEIRDKIKATNIERYGAENPLGSSEIRKNIEEILLSKYGARHPFQSEEIKERARNTWIQRYGVDNPSKSEGVVKKIKETFIRKYGDCGMLNIPEFREKIMKTTMERYGVPYGIMTPNAINSNGSISKVNLQIGKYLDDEGIQYQSEYVIENRRYDFRLLHSNILLEIDPSYTHSIIPNHYGAKINMYYHIEKSRLAESNGLMCIHIFDWDNVRRIINQLQSRYAIDEYEIKQISSEEAQEFSDKYDVSETNKKYSITYGAYRIGDYENSLMSIMSFNIVDFNNTWVVSSIVTKPHYTLQDAYKQMLDRFISEFDPQSMIIHSDNAKSTGSIAKSLGFSKIKDLPPAIIWSKGRSGISHDKVVNDTNMSKSDVFAMMLDDGYLPVPDCGYAIYEWRR